MRFEYLHALSTVTHVSLCPNYPSFLTGLFFCVHLSLVSAAANSTVSFFFYLLGTFPPILITCFFVFYAAYSLFAHYSYCHVSILSNVFNERHFVRVIHDEYGSMTNHCRQGYDRTSIQVALKGKSDSVAISECGRADSSNN